MIAIFRREFQSYFFSVRGYLFLAFYITLLGYRFTMLLYSGVVEVYSTMMSLVAPTMFIIPLLTASSYASDRKFNTRQYLHSSPLSRTGWVMGKFFAPLILFAVALAVTFIHLLLLRRYMDVRLPYFFSNLCAFTCLVAALIAIGQFSSMLADHPFKGTLIYYGIMFAMLSIDLAAMSSGNAYYSKLAGYLSFSKQFRTFPAGLFSPPSLLFYTGITVLFLFLIIRVLEHRRWKEGAL